MATPLALTYLANDFAVAPQILPEHMAALAREGFRTILNNRLEQEPGQPPQDELRAAAEAAGLRYEWQPVSSGMITPQDVARFADLMEHVPRPLLAFCRSGTRCTMLYQAARRMYPPKT
jgi:uncharacterized protein (TIGR01244 family)